MNSLEITAQDIYVLLSVLGLALFGNWLGRHLKQHTADAMRLAVNGLIPVVAVFWITDQILSISRDTALAKVQLTLGGIIALWVVALTLTAAYLHNASEDSVRGRTPKLLLGIFSFFFVTIGGLFLFAEIWKKDLSPLLTTFGVGSIVLGLALQDTLGNLFAGLALVFDKPFSVGDWVQVGDIVGRVQGIDWRSVRVVTRELNEITIPNVTLGKERIVNFSFPNPLYGLRVTIGFSYEAPPNEVKKMLTAVALETPGVVSNPYPDIRTLNYNAYTIDYESFFFISDYGPLNRIRSEFMTRVWYAAKRNGISIPYPTTTMFKTEVPAKIEDEKQSLNVFEVVRGVELFKSLTDEECHRITNECRLDSFAKAEAIFREGDPGDHLYVFLSGQVDVQVTGEGGSPVTLATLERGDLIGEMALFTGEPRRASAIARTDVRAARIEKGSMADLLASREDLINAFVTSMSTRLKQAEEAHERHQAALVKEAPQPRVDETALKQRIRRFFGL